MVARSSGQYEEYDRGSLPYNQKPRTTGSKLLLYSLCCMF